MKIVADVNIPFVEECFSSVGEVELLGGREITPKVVKDADALLVRSVTAVNAQLLVGSGVRFVGTATIGFDHVDVEYLRGNNIGFASAPGSNANSAAEYIVAALLEIGHKHQIQLEGKSIGIIGVGNVGSKVAAKCEALGMRVYRNDPPLRRQTGDSKYLPIEELFDCDFITLHTPLTLEGADKTFHLVDERFFKSLKHGCVFLNASRGAVHDTSALKAAIKLGVLKAVALDVWENEPDIDTDLLQLVDLGTPHIAGYSLDGKIAGMIMIYEALCEYFGLRSKFVVEDFLPEPEVPELHIDSHGRDDEDLLLDAVRQVYDIRKDDAHLRQILGKPDESRGRFFDRLRKKYSIRREFQNTTVVIENMGSTLAGKLSGIGFLLGQE